MKSLTKIFLAVFTISLIATQALAVEGPNSKIVEKAKSAVAEASESDWETYAQSAEICLMKKENLEEAFLWIEKSVNIKETAYNLEVKGDFLLMLNRKSEAKKAYYQAILAAKEGNPTAQNKALQQKLWDLR